MTAYDDDVPLAELGRTLHRSPAEIWDRLDRFGRVTSADRRSAPITGFPRLVLPEDFVL
ncbi:hypothetical protein [Streptomyces sp. NPDC053069]|uniref:hypothetical protein n=1 Tax=Streptomyces sp. NPDC053069 TaxID=3365695 RepID=UPI0037CCEF43